MDWQSWISNFFEIVSGWTNQIDRKTKSFTIRWLKSCDTHRISRTSWSTRTARLIDCSTWLSTWRLLSRSVTRCSRILKKKIANSKSRMLISKASTNVLSIEYYTHTPQLHLPIPYLLIRIASLTFLHQFMRINSVLVPFSFSNLSLSLPLTIQSYAIRNYS